MIELPKMRWPRQLPLKVYIRFGRWSTYSHNWSTWDRERGVSVYPAILSKSIVSLDASEFDIHVPAIQGRLVFAVTGVEVGVGSDGEPLLRGVRALPFAIDYMSMPCGIERSAWA